MKDSLEKRLGGIATKIINPKIGVVTGTISASYAFFVNVGHGLTPAALASGKQFAFSFLFGGFVGKICQYFAKMENKYLAWTLGEIVPSIIMSSTLYTIHKFSGTPEPLKSIILPAAIGLTVYGPAIIYLTRKGYLK
ncbi:MAG: hypothetical protein IB618_00570 [Candidatus Pacearchaeota archaeon]|nr:MAG: hypothetical protein IB618_00570 [Candidatus Pacearchaeota archaeon]